MTRDEFMKKAEQDISKELKVLGYSIMGIVQQAWAGGKKSADEDDVSKYAADIIEAVKKQFNEEKANSITASPNYDKIWYVTTPVSDSTIEDDLK